MFITATEVTQLTNISASAGTITANGIIPLTEERLNLITYNYFDSDLDIQTGMTFNATARTIVSTSSFADAGFLDDDIIYVYGSYRNDGYYSVNTVSSKTLTLATGESVVSELSGRSIYISVVQFPKSLKVTLAQMIKYDYDDRKDTSANVTSKRLGPWAESYAAKDGGSSNGKMDFGYPPEIMGALAPYTIARVM